MRSRCGFRVSLRGLGPAALAVLVVGLGGPDGGAQAQAQTGAASEGETLFKATCVACHTIGGGNLVGPDLSGVTQRRSREWLSRWILEPDRMLAEGDPTAQALLKEFHGVPMPNAGLQPAQVAALIAYIEGGSAASPAQPAALPEGDPSVGKALFVGERRFENGGPPCMGCHSIAGIGALGGGALGPDLTPAIHKYGGDRGLASFLAGNPTPTMNAVWARHPLTEGEQADVRAFMNQASVSGRPIEALGRLGALSAGGALVLLVLAQLRWSKRLVAVRRPLVARMRRDRAA